MPIACFQADVLLHVVGALSAGWLLRAAYERRFRGDHERLLIGLVREALASSSDPMHSDRGICPESSDNAKTTVYARPLLSARQPADPKTTVLVLDPELRRQLVEGSRR